MSSEATPDIHNPPRALTSLNRDELVQLCRKHSLKASGKNSLLIARLRGHARSLPPDSPLNIASRASSESRTEVNAIKKLSPFIRLGLDVHLNVLSYLQAIDILNVKLTCRSLAATTQHRCVWTNALRNALHTLHIPFASYEDVLKSASIPTLMGMASFPGRIARSCRRGGKLNTHLKTALYAPEGHQFDYFGISPDARVLVSTSNRYRDTTLSVWDLAVDSQLPILRHKQELPDRQTLVRNLSLAEDGSGVIILTYEDLSADEIAADNRFKLKVTAYIYSYATRCLSVKGTTCLAERFLSVNMFGDVVLFTWQDGSVFVWTVGSAQEGVNFSIPPDYKGPDGIYMSERNLLIAKSGYTIFARPKEDVETDAACTPLLSLKDPIGLPTAGLSYRQPFEPSTLAMNPRDQFLVERSRQGHVCWSNFSETTLKGAQIELLPGFVGSTALPGHDICRGNYGPWEKGFIAVVQSPLAVLLMDGHDQTVAHWVDLNVNVPNHINYHLDTAIFSPLHGNVYALSRDRTSVVIYQFFCRPPLF